MKAKLFNLRLSGENYLADQEELSEFMESVSVQKTDSQIINDQINFWSVLVFYEPKGFKTSGHEKPEKASFPADAPLNNEERKVLDSLRSWRQSKSEILTVPMYMICTNAELVSLVKLKPQNAEDLSKIKGFGNMKISKFGTEIVELLNSVQ